MKELELLAPARNADIGIAAIDCGADAVYIAGPSFGARKDAGNSVDEIARLCRHAARYGARVFVTVNTIIYDEELPAVRELVGKLIDAGADALIVQDLALTAIVDELAAGGRRRIPLHASTQCAIRTADTAAFLASRGFARLILERELSLEQVAEIRRAAPQCELEFFVHGALCVCYSGQCYLSELLAGRSANRGACIQACRSRYDLLDDKGNVVIRDKSLLSLADLNMQERIGELAQAGISSFKIEGRLKNESYVRNVVRSYSEALDRLIAGNPGKWRRASFGQVTGSFSPDTDKTFNRGYTELFLGGKRGKWAAMDAAKGMGEEIGTVISAEQNRRNGESVITVKLREAVTLCNGDGFSFVPGSGDPVGFRGDICENAAGGRQSTIRTLTRTLPPRGCRIFRNYDAAFEKDIKAHPGTRLIRVEADVISENGNLVITALSEDGRSVEVRCSGAEEKARDRERMAGILSTQLGKSSGIYRFSVHSIQGDELPVMSVSAVNAARRELAEKLETMPCRKLCVSEGKGSGEFMLKDTSVTYKANVANHIAENIYRMSGAEQIGKAYELTHIKGAELMRSRYCLRHELGMCLKEVRDGRRLFLRNNGRLLELGFDCARCEMTVKEAQ